MKKKIVKMVTGAIYSVAKYTSMAPSRSTIYDEPVPKKFLK